MNTLDVNEAKELAEFLKKIAQFQRLQILALLVRGSLSVNEIETKTSITQPTLSQHLGVLRRAGLIVSEKKGRLTIYSIFNEKELRRVKLVLALLHPVDINVFPATSFDHSKMDFHRNRKKTSSDIGAQFARILTENK